MWGSHHLWELTSPQIRRNQRWCINVFAFHPSGTWFWEAFCTLFRKVKQNQAACVHSGNLRNVYLDRHFLLPRLTLLVFLVLLTGITSWKKNWAIPSDVLNPTCSHILSQALLFGEAMLRQICFCLEFNHLLWVELCPLKDMLSPGTSYCEFIWK